MSWQDTHVVVAYITGHPLDECYCGDYRRDHAAGVGVCSVCQALNPPWLGKCRRFRISNPATQEDVDRFKAMGMEYPEVKDDAAK